MNQKYLQGFSSDMESPDNAVFFEATPENITAFLMQYQRAQMSAIGTVDNRLFLTAKIGLIDTCPDQEYLSKKLLPIYAKVQMGDIPVPELKTVPEEAVLAEKCPTPDWNYLYWEGYSNKKYQTILSGKGLLDWEQDGKIHKVELQVRPYMDRNNLAIEIVCWDSGEPEPWESLTVNLDGRRDKNCAFVDSSLKADLILWLDKNGLAKHTGSLVQNGPTVYAEYRFIAKRLKELDPDGYRVYEERYTEARKAQQPSRKKGGNER